MKAILSHTPGDTSTLVLGDIPDPVPAAGEVLMAVRACGVNYLDTLIIADKYQTRPARPFSPGAEMAGVVLATGPGVTQVKPGTRVVGWHIHGGMAEKALVRAESCVALPDAVGFDVGASLVLAYGTSLHALRDRARLRAGETVLVLGAAGGVGLAAVELAKHMGARVLAACSSQEKLDVAVAHGADAGLVYPAGVLTKEQARAFTDAVKQAAPSGVNVIYDPVGGDFAEATVRAMAWDGRYLVVGFAGSVPKLPLNLLLLKNGTAIGVYWGGVMDRDPLAYAAYAKELLGLVDGGAIKPTIFQRFPLDRAREAIQALSSRKVIGKVVVEPAG